MTTEFQILRTADGIRFGLLGQQRSTPSPLLFVFALDIAETLGNEAYVKAGRILMKSGWLCASLDLPSHGLEVKDGETGAASEALHCWRKRIERGEAFLPGFLAKCSAVLDHLIREGCVAAGQVAALGTSRGGFIALHFAAHDPRVGCVGALAPVTDLRALSEFVGMENDRTTESLSLVHVADKLARRNVWICIGNHDERVDTGPAIAFGREVVKHSYAQGKPANIEMHIMAVPGHSTHPTSHDDAAAWIAGAVSAS